MGNYKDLLYSMKLKEQKDAPKIMYAIRPEKKTQQEDEKNTDSWFKKPNVFGDGKGNLLTDGLAAIGGSVADVILGVGEGFAGMVEGVSDFALHGVSKASDLLGADEFAKTVKGVAMVDSTKEMFAPVKEVVDEASVFGDKSDNVSKGLGQVAGILLTGKAGMAAGLSTIGTTALTTGTMFASSAGQGMTEALNEGATDKEAAIYGMISGAGDAVTELIFGGLGKSFKALGIGKGLSSADDMLAKTLSNKINNQIAKNIVEFGVKAGAEGTEEVLSGIISAAGKKITYMSEKDLNELINDERLLEQFVVGAVTSGVAQSGYVPGMKNGSVREANATGRDYISGYTANEQKVIDKEVENRIAELKDSGQNVSKKEKQAIIEQVQRDIEKGYVSIDTIESALGGEAYKNYRTRIDTEEQLKKKIESIKNIPESQITVGQREELNEARKKLEELQETDIADLKGRLSEEMASVTSKDMYLRESYNEKGRRSQTYDADVSKYSQEQQSTIQRAIDSGILNNTRRTHEFVDMIAKISADKGVSFDFADSKKLKESGFAVEGATVNGYVKGKDITLNINSAKALNKVVGHEITHVLEGTDVYSELQEAVRAYAESKGEYQKRYDALANLYEDVEGAAIENELTADLIGDYLFTDEDFIHNLSTEQPSIFKRIYEEIKYLVKVATAGSKEAKQLEKVKRVFEKAYKQTSNSADSDVKYSLETTEDKKLYQYVQDALNDKLPNKSYYKISESISDRMAKDIEGIVGFSVQGYGNEISPNSIRHIRNEHGENGTKDSSMKSYHDLAKIAYVIEHYDKMREGKKSEEFRNSDGTYAKTIELQKKIDDNFYYVVEAVPDAKNKTLHIVSAYKNKKDTFSDELVSNDPKRYVLDEHQPNVSLNNIVPRNAKMSISDNKSRTFTKEQQEYFKDSKVVDDLIIEKDELLFKTRGASQGNQEPSNSSSSIYSVLQSIINGNNLYDITLKEASSPHRTNLNTRGELASNDSITPSEKNTSGFNKISEKSQMSISNGTDNDIKGYGVYGKDLLYQGLEAIGSLAISQETDPKIIELAKALQKGKEAAVDYEPNPDNFGQTVKTVEQRENAKLENYKVELASKKKQKEDSYRQYNRDIAEKYEYLKMEKDQNSEDANIIKAQIAELKTSRDNIQADLDKSIQTLEERIKKMSTPEYKRNIQKQQKQSELREEISKLMGDTSVWKDKKSGLGYKLHTLKRNLRDVTGDIKKADELYRYLQGGYNQNEAKLNTESNTIKKAYADMKINKYEDQYIQMLGEYKYNPDTELTADKVNGFYEKHKSKIDTEKVDKVIDMARKTYDDLFTRLNEVLKEYGINEIPYREGYFPHFTREPRGIIAKLLNWKKEDNSIPTDIAGLTENFKPNKSYQSFSQRRTGDKTDYSFMEGLDKYTYGALDWIYHIGDIQKFRAFENEIRYRHSTDGIKEKIKDLEQNELYDADELQAQIDAVYAEAKNPLNNLVQNIRTHTNLLAGKKNTMDRAMEENFNRNMYSVVKNASNRINANMVGGSISSALTNFIPITQSWSQVSPLSSLRAMKDTIKSTMVDDGTIEKSAFLTNRLRKAENLSKTKWDKVSDKISIMMDAIDSFTSQTIWRSKYMENINEGMSESEAILNADEFSEGVMAGRSRGNMPVIFESKNPFTKIFTAFQLEVANQYDYMLKDMPTDMKNKTTGKLVKAYASMFMGAYVYNAIYSSLSGRNAAFDPIRIIQDLISDLFDDKEDEPGEFAGKLIDTVGDNIPYIGGVFFDGGRIPVSAALPYGEGLVEAAKGIATDIGNGDFENLTREMLNPVYYLAFPAGGGQIKKINEGMAMFDDDLPVTGSYTDSGNLRFAVEDNLANRLQATLFGQWASENAKNYIENQRQPLKEKQIEEFAKLGISMEDYWDYREGLKDQKTIEDKFDYVAGLDVTDDQKNIMINNIVNRKEEVDISNYNNFGSYAEFDYSIKNPEKYVISKAIGDFSDYSRYIEDLSNIESDKDENEKAISGSRKKKVVEYINSLDADYGAKIILYKMEYPSDNTYNMEIIEYLGSREDIDYDDTIAILNGLGFNVSADGKARWD